MMSLSSPSFVSQSAPLTRERRMTIPFPTAVGGQVNGIRMGNGMSDERQRYEKGCGED